MFCAIGIYCGSPIILMKMKPFRIGSKPARLVERWNKGDCELHFMVFGETNITECEI
jgi:hypothetical protein